MASLNFEYKIMPYVDGRYERVEALPLPHSETDLLQKGGDVDSLGGKASSEADEEFEKSVRQIYYYQQSYFRDDQVPAGVFPQFTYGGEASESEQFCVNVRWKNAAKAAG